MHRLPTETVSKGECGCVKCLALVCGKFVFDKKMSSVLFYKAEGE